MSDLHFGRTDPFVVEALLSDLHDIQPDVVVISGDLTQRARKAQFAEARSFLRRLPCPSVLVPGNHDLAPVYSPLSRLFRPRARFQRQLPDHAANAVWRDGATVVVGLDSTRAMRWTSGRLRPRHLTAVEEALTGVATHVGKVAFLHHPPSRALAGQPFATLAERGIDLILAGHVHRTHVELITATGIGSSVLLQASTACSTRLRNEANGYGIIRLNVPEMMIELRGWSGDGFQSLRHLRFHKQDGYWHQGT